MKEDLGTLHAVFVEFNRVRTIDPKPEAENARHWGMVSCVMQWRIAWLCPNKTVQDPVLLMK
jgi:hypothetical protein